MPAQNGHLLCLQLEVAVFCGSMNRKALRLLLSDCVKVFVAKLPFNSQRSCKFSSPFTYGQNYASPPHFSIVTKNQRACDMALKRVFRKSGLKLSVMHA